MSVIIEAACFVPENKYSTSCRFVVCARTNPLIAWYKVNTAQYFYFVRYYKSRMCHHSIGILALKPWLFKIISLLLCSSTAGLKNGFDLRNCCEGM